MRFGWVNTRLNIAKRQGEFGNREESQEVQLDIVNGSILWQVTENYEFKQGF